MKKIAAILLFALPLMSLKTIAGNELTRDNVGIVQAIDTEGNGILKDTQTGELKSFQARGDFQSVGAIVVGTPVTYMEIVTPSGKVIVNDIKTGHM